MKGNVRKRSIWLLFLSFMLVTISLTKTSPTHEEVVNILRIAIGGVAILFFITDVIFTVLNRYISRTRFFVLSVGLFLLLYGIVGSVAFGGFSYFVENPELLAIISLSIVFLWASSAVGGELSFRDVDVFFRKWVPIYCFVAFIITVGSGGFSIAFPPKFIFNDAAIDSYSQGISKVYMIGALLTLISFTKYNKKISLVFSVFFLLLSFLGGARGDFGIGFILYSFIVMVYNKKLGAISLLLAVVVSSLSFMSMSELSQDFYIINRFMQLDSSNLGQRDVLAGNALTLLSENTVCVFTGCGFNAFQYFWGYRVGLYPHNVMIEAAITFGLPLAALLVCAYIYCLFKSFLNGKLLNGFTIIGIYLVAIGMKSGTIIDLTLVSFVLNMIVTTLAMPKPVIATQSVN
ncbi:hypothetical protein OFP28_01970 [Escherichia coli]|uniref:hypothetical protein n=2 Tax=Escherichia coli TaxID=562 RepID=UPI00168F5AE8|nr:hypothetical protein [Escherichia coli]EFJ8995251.1 hypothetical protein [Escherichia coli]EIG9174589.1 hypothetical protein [Escherichia coli]EIO1058978.1 hypothetical protein [Escherichia coli]MCV4845195.1 hypothetical protein [Escherichia coli]MCV4897412.1 hypothetical protein [Escherichia coli]